MKYVNCVVYRLEGPTRKTRAKSYMYDVIELTGPTKNVFHKQKTFLKGPESIEYTCTLFRVAQQTYGHNKQIPD